MHQVLQKVVSIRCCALLYLLISTDGTVGKFTRVFIESILPLVSTKDLRGYTTFQMQYAANYYFFGGIVDCFRYICIYRR